MKRLGLLTLLFFFFLPTGFGIAQNDDDQQFGGGEPEQNQNEEAPPPPDATETKAATEVDNAFDSLMQQNMAPPKHAAPAPAMPQPWQAPHPPSDAKAVVPLKEYERVTEALRLARERLGRSQAPAVVLGAADYSAEAKGSALAVTLKFQVTLGQPGRWKTVPLVGDGVVVVSAKGQSGALPIARQAGYHVWITRDTGEASITLELLVPARGPRGSIEFDFVVSRTPVTHFSCRFPQRGLEPRIDTAVHAETHAVGNGTQLDATLRPTTRIHIVGFRDVGENDTQQAKVYAESLNLLSVEAGSLDLFSVVRYTILYGGVREFQLAVPKGFSVVSADGEGAFRYVVEPGTDGAVLRGETEFPIRNGYEVSLRLHRELPHSDQPDVFDAPLPRALKVERETGWLAIEVPGKLKLEEQSVKDVVGIDLRQLPPEMIDSAVSPVLKAYRYHAADAAVRLVATRLPEKDPASASIDRIRAQSVLSPEGTLLTDLKITLRNRLRHSLVLTLPADAVVRSTLLDGQPAKPSKDASNALIVPLMRSSGDDRLKPFNVEIVLEQHGAALGWTGHPELSLPGVDLPVSSLLWTLWVPANNLYSAPVGDLAEQTLAGEASWFQPSAAPPTRTPSARSRGASSSLAPAAAAASADSGAMPVRIKLPESGVRLDHRAYWLEGGKPHVVRISYLRRALALPLAFLFGLMLTAGLFTVRKLRLRAPEPLPMLGAFLVLLATWPLLTLAGRTALALSVTAALLWIGSADGWLGRGIGKLGAWWRSLPERYRQRPIVARVWYARLGRAAFALGMLVTAGVFVRLLFKLIGLLRHPLGG